MVRVIISDIFGRTPALETICSQLAGPSIIIDPYMGDFLDFKDEAEAYAFFSRNVGLDVYSELVKKAIFGRTGQLLLIGFSVGASAIWLNSNQVPANAVLGAICFYGSQIRHTTNLIPSFPVDVIMPEQEDHFSVVELADKLEKIRNVTVHQSSYPHGFMNRFSKNFSQDGYAKYLTWLNNHQLPIN